MEKKTVKSPDPSYYCCVAGCTTRCDNRNHGVKLYRFPGKPSEWSLRESWIDAVRRLNCVSFWEPVSSSRVCSNHFIGGRRSRNPLNPNSVPSILVGEDLKSCRESSKPPRLRESLRSVASIIFEGLSPHEEVFSQVDEEFVELLEVRDAEVQVDEFPPIDDMTFVFSTDRVSRNCVGVQCCVYYPERILLKCFDS